MKTMTFDAGGMETRITIVDTEKNLIFIRNFTKFIEEMSMLEIVRFALLKVREYDVDEILVRTDGLGQYAYETFLRLGDADIYSKLIALEGKYLR